MTRDTLGQTHAETPTESQLPNQITIVGRGVPSNFELAVAGDLEMVADEPVEEATIVLGGVAEGTIDAGV